MTLSDNRSPLIPWLAMATLALAGCERAAPPPPEPTPTATPMPEPTTSPISILRETPEAPTEEVVPSEPFIIVVPFAEGGTALSEAAEAAIGEVVASRQFELGGRIVLRGHTDSVGHDQANLRASQRRAEAVAKALEESGADSEKITIIALGEMRAIAPNAKLDGTPDEEGRAMNRRVEVTVAAPVTKPVEGVDLNDVNETEADDKS